MSTTATMPEQAPATTEAPAQPNPASVLYDDAPAAANPPVVSDPPAQTPVTDPSPQPDKAAASPPVDAKQPEPPVAPADEKDPVKQLSEQTAANRRLGREVAEAKQLVKQALEENRILKAKLDGTYEEPTQPTAEQVQAQAEWRGRERASRPVAYDQFGEKEVEAQVYADDSPYAELVKEKPWVHIEVMKHPQPAVAAMNAINREAFVAKYGNDPRKWAEKIADELKPKLLEELKKQVAQPVVGKEVPSVATGRSTGGPSGRSKSLADILYG